jgi:hypothetical protein
VKEEAVEAEALDEFGRLLIQQARDRAIRHWDKILEGQMKGSSAQRAAARLAPFTAEQREVLRRLIADVSDTVLHYLLWTLEEEAARISINVRVEGGVVANLAEVSGEFPAELYTEDGWIARFSKERHFNILED